MSSAAAKRALLAAIDPAAPAKAAAAIATPRTAPLGDDDDQDGDREARRPWEEEEDWVPRTKSGKQKSPNQIRGELQRHIDASPETQTAIVARMGVNNNTFRRFMNPKTYKDQWSACQNGTYWAAARLLAEEAHKKKSQPAKKRKGVAAALAGVLSSGTTGHAAKKAKTTPSKAEGVDLMARINAVAGVALREEAMDGSCLAPDRGRPGVHDSCLEVVGKIKKFLSSTGISKAAFCLHALEGANNNSLSRFLLAKQQDQAGNKVYRLAYLFFEKKRLLDGAPKSKARLRNEAEWGEHGFRCTPPPRHQWVFCGGR